jgi:hypothetical protein
LTVDNGNAQLVGDSITPSTIMDSDAHAKNDEKEGLSIDKEVFGKTM